MINLFNISNKYFYNNVQFNHIANEVINTNISKFNFLFILILFILFEKIKKIKIKKKIKKNLPHEGIEPPLPDQKSGVLPLN